jgi:transposase-like protein
MVCLKSERSVAELCRENSIGQSSYYQWRALFIQGGTERLRRSVIRISRPKKQVQLRAPQDADRMRFIRRVAAFLNPRC